MHVSTITGALLSALVTVVHGHSWITNMTLSSGPTAGKIVGYPRNYRGHIDTNEVNLISDPSLAVPVCKQAKRGSTADPSQTVPPGTSYPILRARPGDFVTVYWKDNGHVTLDQENPDLTKFEGQSSGKVYIFGSDEVVDENSNPTVKDVMEWTKDGGKEAVLLGESKFDDGFCAEDNTSAIARERFADGHGGDCKVSIRIPEDVDPEQGWYTLMWVWDFSQKEGANGPTQWYTSCADVQIVKDAPQPETTAKKMKRKLRASAKFRNI